MRLLLAAFALPLFAADPAEFFESKVRPVLANRCYSCHALTPQSGLAVNSRAALLKGGQRGPAVVPGKPDESLLLTAVRHGDPKLQMPFNQPKLSAAEIADLASWISAGAPWPEAAVSQKSNAPMVITAEQRSYWAFAPLAKPAAGTSIDSLVRARLTAKGLAQNPPAAKRDLIRRAYFDLTGLPPSAAAVDAFLADRSPEAFAKVVDQLLASPRYGERWGRYWLDIARYADDKLSNDVFDPYPNSFRYRNWVIAAMNRDMPYDLFVKAQIAGDLLPKHEQHPDLAVGLGFYGLSPELVDDRVDATTRGFLAMTAACAQCHDHKFDPIPTRDFYALQSVFSSTKRSELPLAPTAEVAEYKRKEAKVKELEARIQTFLHEQATSMAKILTMQSPQYLAAARRVLVGPNPVTVEAAAAADHLDLGVLKNWVRYLKTGPEDNQYLKGWQSESFDANAFRDQCFRVLAERDRVDEENLVRKANAKGAKNVDGYVTVSLKTEDFFLWRDLYFSDFYGKEFKQEEDGILYFGPNRGYLTSDGTIERFLTGPWAEHLKALRAELKERKAALPAQYAYAHVIEDLPNPKNQRIHINGQPDNLGPEVPRGFLSVLNEKPFTTGSGRLELANAMVAPENALTPRVMVNRVWAHHFGEGIVPTVSNFGRMGGKPSNQELLDYLAASFVNNGWSLKKLHREILLSATYQLSAANTPAGVEKDPANRLLWRANRQRLDAESLRDALLEASAELDVTPGAEPADLAANETRKRTIYGLVSRRKLDGTLALFDFPNPNATGEQRNVTATALQQLFFLNSDFVDARARKLAADAAKATDRVGFLYRAVFSRNPEPEERKLSMEFTQAAKDPWTQLAKALLSSNEFLFVN